MSGASFGVGLLAAALGRNSDHDAFDFLHRVADKIEQTVAAATAPEIEPPHVEVFQTAFLGLEGNVITLPLADRPGAGGAVTMIGDTALVLRFDGEVFSVRADGTVSRPAIEMPQNGFEAYMQTAEKPEYAEFRHRPDRFRYNDLVYYDGPLGPRLLTSYLQWHAEDACFTTTVAQLALEERPQGPDGIEASAQDWEELFRTNPCLPWRDILAAIQGEKAGGRMAISADGRSIYIANGDYGWDGLDTDGRHPLSGTALSQKDGVDYGKVIEIDLETGQTRQVSSGHRNPQGLALDAQQRLWTVEHGVRGGDELNLVREGSNYGWPLESYSTQYNGAPIPTAISPGEHDTFSKPILAWLPSVAPSGLLAVEGFHPTWDGDLLITTLVGRKLIRVRIEGERVVFAEDIPMDRRMRNVEQMPDGRIVVWTDNQEVIFLRPLEGSHAEQFVEHQIAALDRTDEEKAHIRAAMAQCSECHSLSRGEHRIGPSLADVAGARIARRGFEGYSEALRDASGSWTQKLLTAFIADPQSTFPGTTMPQVDFADPSVPGDIARLLEALAEMDL